jgi:SPP1 gp7 family putative phage head morphogenesis protein
VQKYNVALLMQRTGRKSANVLLPPISERLSMQREYLKALRAMLKALRAEVIVGILPKYTVFTADADAQSFDRLRRIAEYLVRTAQATVNRILNLESQRHTEKFMQTARTALGIDISAVVTQEDLGEYLQLAAQRNADLIKSQTDTMIRRIEQATIQNKLAGNPVSTLRKQFIEEFGIADRKAKLLARDQSSKLTSDLNRIRQQQAGIEEYRWLTVHDERVRPLHRDLDGKEYKWGERTGAENGLPPGQPIQCRCIARGKVVYGQIETTPSVNTAVIDREMKDYVLDNGRKTGVEHLWSYDTVTGEKIGLASGTKGHVGFTPEFLSAISDPKRSIVAHHNHPRSSSFSNQDILELNRQPGLSGLWAHGHNGSSYYAKPGKFSNDAKIISEMERASEQVRAFIQDKITRRVVEMDIVNTHQHVVMLVAEKRGIVSQYLAELQAEHKASFERYREMFLEFLKGLEE